MRYWCYLYSLIPTFHPFFLFLCISPPCPKSQGWNRLSIIKLNVFPMWLSLKFTEFMQMRDCLKIKALNFIYVRRKERKRQGYITGTKDILYLFYVWWKQIYFWCETKTQGKMFQYSHAPKVFVRDPIKVKWKLSEGST